MLGDNWELNHVGLMITNRNATLRHFQSIGVGVSVGPQPLLPHEPGEGSLMYYRTLEGDPVTNTYRTGGAHTFNDGESQIGDCQLECYPMRPGPGMFISEYLEKQGPGINHICFNSDTIVSDTDVFLDNDCALVFDARVNGRTVENYLDTRKFGNMMISLRPPPTDWERSWKANNEAHPLVNDWRFRGVGIGVRDLDSTVSYYEELGFSRVDDRKEVPGLETERQSLRVGPILFDFCSITSEASVYRESLKRRGEGVNDLAFEVSDLEQETDKLKQKGVEVLARSQDKSEAYFDTRGEGNIMIRLMQGKSS